jgi:hypothetical protein
LEGEATAEAPDESGEAAAVTPESEFEGGVNIDEATPEAEFEASSEGELTTQLGGRIEPTPAKSSGGG